MATPVIIEVALNGATSKQQNSHVPRSPAEIAEDGRGCLEVGAAIVHTHVDEMSADPERAAKRYEAGWRPILDARPDALLYPTIGFGETFAERYAHHELLADRGLARLALERGGHLRVGLEDFAGARRPSNAELVREAVELAAAVGRPVASCAEAAAILDLPGH